MWDAGAPKFLLQRRDRNERGVHPQGKAYIVGEGAAPGSERPPLRKRAFGVPWPNWSSAVALGADDGAWARDRKLHASGEWRATRLGRYGSKQGAAIPKGYERRRSTVLWASALGPSAPWLLLGRVMGIEA